MRVVYLHQYFVTPEMPGGTRTYEMARRLVRDGHEVHVITSDRKGGPRRTEDIDGIQINWIPVRYSQSMSVFQRVLSFLLFAVLASIEGMKKRPTVVFATSTPLTILFPALAIKLFRRVPLVFEVRDLWPEMPIAVGALTNPVLIRCARWMEKLAYSQSSKVIALSPGMKDGVVQAGYPESNVVTVPNASDINNFQVDPQVGRRWLEQQEWYRGGPVLLYAGSFGLINDVGYLVELAHHARKLNPELVVLLVGAGRESQKVRKRSEELGILGQNVIMLEQVPKRDLPVIYSAATIASSTVGNFPSAEMNSANKFFDTLAAGRPIMINHGGWQKDLIEKYKCGLCLPRNPEQAATDLVEFLGDAELVRQSGENALRLAKEQFDRDKLYGRFSEVLIAAEAG